MNLRNLVLILFILFIIVSCRDRKVISSNKYTVRDKENNSKIKKEDEVYLSINLPFKLDSTSSYLIYPVWKSSIHSSQKLLSRSYKQNRKYPSRLINLVFQNIKTEETHLLSTSKISINAYELLVDRDSLSEKIIVYQINDFFPKSKDNLIINSLYLGSIDGKMFKKITTQNEHLSEWKYIPETKKIYYRTIEDSDTNNILNSLDKTHTYSVSIENFKVNEILLK